MKKEKRLLVCGVCGAPLCVCVSVSDVYVCAYAAEACQYLCDCLCFLCECGEGT